MEPQFDRGEVDRASLEATERLRARLANERLPKPDQRPRSSLPWVVAGGLFVFSAGMIANPWFEANVRQRLPFAGTPQAAAPDVTALNKQLADIEARADTAEDAAPPSERLARTEAKVETSTDQLAREADRIDRLTGEVASLAARLDADRARDEAAAGQVAAAAARSEAMLVVILARRAVEQGRPLGAIDPVLRRAFDARYPEAVAAVAALGAAPVSMARLELDFAALRSVLGAGTAAPGARQGWWDTLKQSVRAMVTRDEPGVAAPAAAAAAALARGDVRAAANHLRRLPAPRPAGVDRWLANADRLATGSAALAILEAAAVNLPIVAGPEPAVAQPVPGAILPGAGAAPAADRESPLFSGLTGVGKALGAAVRSLRSVRAALS